MFKKSLFFFLSAYLLFFMSSSFTYACICYNNLNRSMEGHRKLKQRGFKVCSYGVGPCVSTVGDLKFEFGTKYSKIKEDVEQKIKDDNRYTEDEKRRILDLYQRDADTKDAPEDFKATFGKDKDVKTFDVIFTYDYKDVLPEVLKVFDDYGDARFKLCFVVNIDTKDDFENAELSANVTEDLVDEMENTCVDELELSKNIYAIVEKFNEIHGDGKVRVFPVSY